MSQTIQLYIVSIFQVVIALGLVNVWLVRFNKPTKYRGASAGSMQAEFLAYGLPVWFMYMVGAAKILIATAMIVGFWIPILVYPASALLVLLMIGAIAMHSKVKDPIVRSVPAILMLLMALSNVLLIGFSK
ncbi:MAG: DoxX family protein [bacterium]